MSACFETKMNYLPPKNVTLKEDTLQGLWDITLDSFDLIWLTSTSSEDDDVTVTPLMVTDVGAPMSRIGTEGAVTGDGPEDIKPLCARAPTVASLVMLPPLVLPNVNS